MTLEAVTEALVTLFTAAVTPTPVIDGPSPTEQAPSAYIIVGSTGDDSEDATVDLVASDMGAGTWEDETGEVQCVAYSWGGNGTLAQHRVIAQGLVDACRATVKTNRTLSGVLVPGYLARITHVGRTQQQTDGGPVVRLGFTVTWDNLIVVN